jgi:hypothetical protein
MSLSMPTSGHNEGLNNVFLKWQSLVRQQYDGGCRLRPPGHARYAAARDPLTSGVTVPGRAVRRAGSRPG